MNILVIAAHPDDEVLGAGGAMAKHVNNGDTVSVLILGQGMFSREQSKQTAQLETLQNHSKNALKKLGVSDVQFLDFPDNSFDSVPLLKVVKAVENKIKETKPETICTHHFSDLNIDHRITFKAVITAARPINPHVKRILCFEIPSSTEWSSESFFQPNYFIDISSTLKQKLQSLSEYKTEMRDFPHPRSLKYVEALATVRGGTANVKAAEAFVLVREIR